MKVYSIIVFATVCIAALVLINCSGSDSPTQPTKNPPDITSFTATPSDIVPGDSVTLTYAVSRATAVRLYPGGDLLTEVTAGSIKVGPLLPMQYAIVATNSDGKDSAAVSITMTAVTPSLTQFDLLADTILIGDSTELTWQALRADSIVVNGGVGKLSSAVNGSRFLKPATTTSYRAIAYNQYGTDTATVTARVEIPAVVDAPNGTLCKGVMGGSTATPALQFTVRDAQAQLLKKPYIRFSIIMGDGALSADSAQVDGTGYAHPTYTFSGLLGYAVIRAKIPGIDSVDVSIRADAVVPGGTFPQGQYLLIGDQFSTVKALDGNPISIDPDPRPAFPLNYAVYEGTLGVVAVIEDVNDNNVAEDDEPVNSVILNTIYSKKTKDGIGVGSTIAEVQNVYGVVTGTYDGSDPANPAYIYIYPTVGLTFFTDISANRLVFEIHIGQGATPGAPRKAEPGSFRSLTFPRQ